MVARAFENETDQLALPEALEVVEDPADLTALLAELSCGATR